MKKENYKNSIYLPPTHQKISIMEDKIVTLKNYDSMVEAMFDQEVLRANHIECFINNEQVVELYPMFADIDEGLKIVVFEKDLEKAQKVLEEYHRSAEKSV
jgi:hypothetical protein